MSKETIKIVKLGRKEQPSKFKEGDTYNITTILDAKNRKLAAMGKWADSWKVGDEVEAIIEEKKWTDKDGFEQTSLRLKNPNASPGGFRGGRPVSPWVSAYTVAATLLPLITSKKKLAISDFDQLAIALKDRMENGPAGGTKTDATPEVDVNDDVEVETKKESKNEDVDDDDDDELF